jgi:hypothetical protein
MNQLGIPASKQRIAEFEIDSVIGFGTLAILKQGWPQLFNQISSQHKAVRSYV